MLVTRSSSTLLSIKMNMKNIELLLKSAKISINLHSMFNTSDNVTVTFFASWPQLFYTKKGPAPKKTVKERKKA